MPRFTLACLVSKATNATQRLQERFAVKPSDSIPFLLGSQFPLFGSAFPLELMRCKTAMRAIPFGARVV
eukprot:2892368-Amphidinium_carterae.1